VITEVLQGLGSWEVRLVEETPQHVLDQLDWFGHVAVVSGPVDVEAAGDELLRRARYVGVHMGKTDDDRGLSGSGMVRWLGDEDDKARQVFISELSLTNKTLLEAVTAVLPATVTVGTVHPQPNAAQRYEGKHRFQSSRKALQSVCDAFGVEFRVNGDASVDVGTKAQLYRALPGAAVPQPLVVRKGAGADVDVIALPGAFNAEKSLYDYTTDVVVIGQTTDEKQFATGQATASSLPYRDLFGNPVRVYRLISQSSETESSAPAVAQLKLNEFNRIRRSLSLRAEEYESEGAFAVGDDLYAYDPETGITDPNNELYFNGRVVHPDVIRCSGIAWPLVQGMTVGFRRGSGVWLDLTPYVTWESGGNDITLGDLPKSLSRPTDDPLQLRVDAARGLDKVAPGPPTGLTLTTYALQDPGGGTTARIVGYWTAPTANADGSVPVDVSYYVFRWRVVGRPEWQTTVAAETNTDVVGTLDMQHEVQVAAVDARNNQSDWTLPGTIIASADNIAPPAPADPVVSNWLQQLRIVVSGLAADGTPMPPDTNRIEAHQGLTATFTPDLSATSTTRVDSAPPGGAVLYGSAPYGETRWVRLVAVDHSGNSSTPSGAVSGSTSKVVEDDVFDGAIGSAKLKDLAVITAKIADLAVNNAKIGNLDVGKLIAGTFTADLVNAGRIRNATSGTRYDLDGTAFRWYRDNTLTAEWSGADATLRLYNTTDATHTSTGHAIQFGATTGQNLVIDDNEILSRFNGSYGTLLLNREGGQVLIGGKVGGFPTSADTGVIPADQNHSVVARASFQIYNVSDAHYTSEYPPLLIGRPGAAHLWLDNNEIGATASTGDAVGILYLQGRRTNLTGAAQHHNQPVVFSSDSSAIRRFGDYSAGTRSSLWYGLDGIDLGVRMSGNQDTVYITSADASVLKPIVASNVSATSARAAKHSVEDVPDALAVVKGAKAQRWKYIPEIEAEDRWHVGPMFEDLAAVPGMVVRIGDPAAESTYERYGSVSLSSMLGIAWEATRVLAGNVDALAAKVADLEAILGKASPR
jgi:hypothetical protein